MASANIGVVGFSVSGYNDVLANVENASDVQVQALKYLRSPCSGCSLPPFSGRVLQVRLRG